MDSLIGGRAYATAVPIGTRPDGTTIRYFGRYAESRDGRLIKYYWAGERMIASLDIPGVAYSEAPPGRPTPSPPWLPVLLLGVFGGVVLLIAWTPRGAEIRVGVRVAPARALATSSLLLLTSTPLLLAPQCGGEPVLRHFHVDHLGSVIAKSNDVGAMVSQIRYRAYGEVRGHYTATGGAIPATQADRHEWTGYEAEPEAGLAYAGARYYDPAIGQFLSHDPARQYASPYAYGPGDPVNGTDPSGMLFGFLGDLFKGLKKLLGDAGDAVDRALPSSVSMNVSAGYTHRFGEQGRTSQPGAERANPGEAIVRGYAMYGVSSRYAVYAAVVAMRNGGAAVGGPMVGERDAFALTSSQSSEGGSSGPVGAVGTAFGAIWNLPNTVVGAVYGGVGHLIGLLGGASPGVRFEDGQLQFTNNPLTATAITFGHVGVYGRGVDYQPDALGISGERLGIEEFQHTRQGNVLGPLYLPAHLAFGATAASIGTARGERSFIEAWHGPANLLEVGPHTSPPRPWWWR